MPRYLLVLDRDGPDARSCACRPRRCSVRESGRCRWGLRGRILSSSTAVMRTAASRAVCLRRRRYRDAVAEHGTKIPAARDIPEPKGILYRGTICLLVQMFRHSRRLEGGRLACSIMQFSQRTRANSRRWAGGAH